jgi:hypothetical protein
MLMFTSIGVSGTAGAITSTSTTSRQVQFGLELLWQSSGDLQRNTRGNKRVHNWTRRGPCG